MADSIHISKRKKEVLNLIAQGETVVSTAKRLGITKRTTYLYIYQLKIVFEANSLCNLVYKACLAGMIQE
jgi:DNA-binding NarL/FixJ family response regulator